MARHLVAVFIVVLATVPVLAAQMDPETLVKRVGHVFAGYDDFWVWMTQQEREPGGTFSPPEKGRAFYKRDRMFRVNFGQPPTRVEGTDGKVYWVYDAKHNTIRYCKAEDAPIHPLVVVFAMSERMVKAFHEFFNVVLLEETVVGDAKLPAYKLVLSLKPEKLAELHKGESLAPDAKQTWTFWVDKKTSLPTRIDIEMEDGRKFTFELGTFHYNLSLDERLFEMPRPEGITPVHAKKGG